MAVSSPALRLTLISGVAVMRSAVSGATRIYATPVSGGAVPIHDGTAFQMVDFPEVYQDTTDATKSPSAVSSNKVYDLYAWNDAGTLRVTRGPEWASQTSRGYAFINVAGIFLNPANITNGPAQGRGTWVGSIATNATGGVDWIPGYAASGGGASRLMIANAFNRVPFSSIVTDSGAGYYYAVQAIRAARGSANNRVTFLNPDDTLPVTASYTSVAVNPAVVGAMAIVGIGFDTTTAFSIPLAGQQNVVAAAVTCCSDISGMWNASAGVHYVSAVEKSGIATNDAFDTQSNNMLTTTAWL